MSNSSSKRGEDQQPLGKLLFTFAVIADTHVTEQEQVSSSPWEVNKLANGRCRYVVQHINEKAPAFVLHLGDIVHPVPAQASFLDAASQFHQLAAQIECPLYITPGNHDVGDKVLDWMPAGTVNDQYIALYETHFGKHFYSFDVHSCHFIIINAQIINSGLACEEDQRDWLEKDLAANSAKRTFLCTHYPPYVSSPDEASSYDNIDEPGRSWLLNLLETYNTEALFAGHVHNFWYDRRGNTEMYILPSTAFVRQDYSELYRIEPGAENGRNDIPKLGYLLIHVHEQGHVAHAIRTYGRAVEPNEKAVFGPSTSLAHTKTMLHAPVGVDLRYPWAETIEIAASGGIDEFDRKLVRNDYPVMALWEMGIRKLRIPLHELANKGTRERMRILQKMSHQFTAFSFDVPTGEILQALLAHHDLIVAWEIVVPWNLAEQRLERVSEIKQACAPLNIYWSKLRRREDAKFDGSHYSHMINHGFVLPEVSQIEEFLQGPLARAAVDGFMFRVIREHDPWADIHGIRRLGQHLDIKTAAVVRFAATTPGVVLDDDRLAANRVAETLAAAFAGADMEIFIDTFNDVDRSFFARSGLVDRRYNPRLAGDVFRNLNSVLHRDVDLLSVAAPIELVGGKIVSLYNPREEYFLVLPEQSVTINSLQSRGMGLADSGIAELIDLALGEVQRIGWTSDGAAYDLDIDVMCATPLLIKIKTQSISDSTRRGRHEFAYTA